MSLNEAVLEKLKKILALAQKGATQGEMEAAMRKAQQLALEHNIDLSTVDASGEIKVADMEIVSENVEPSHTYERPFTNQILSALIVCFDVRAIIIGHRTSSQKAISHVTFVGERTDVAIATYSWKFLERAFPKAWADYQKQSGETRWSSSRMFYVGMRNGLIETNRRAREAMPQAARDRYALVLVNKDALVSKKYEELFPKARKLKSRTSSKDASALEAGIAKGKSIRLGAALSSGSETHALR